MRPKTSEDLLSEQFAINDEPTGCTTREQLVDAASAMQARTDGRIGVLICNVDNFSHVNLSYGHDAGDRVFDRLAEIVRCCMGATDSCARTGGAEVVVISDEPREGLLLRAERIRREMCSGEFLEGREPFRVTCSVGVATGPEAGRDWQRLFSSADEALLASLRAGGNVVTAWRRGLERGYAA